MRIAETAARSDPGRTRRHNEDSFVLDPPLFAVCDGMGGAQAGEVASGLAAAALREFHEADGLPLEERVGALVEEANRRVYERAQVDTLVSGMGTTTTAVLVEGSLAAVGHVGDSRAYRLRDGVLEQLTDDHSLVGDLVRSGQLTREEADIHPQRSVITRALGTDPDVDVDTFTVELRDGDLLLLCSDGLTSMVSESEVAGLVREGGPLDELARELVRAANRRGGEDNITVVLFGLAGEPEEATVDGALSAAELDEETLHGVPVPAEIQALEPAQPRKAPRRPRAPAVLTVVALLVAGLGALGVFGLSRAHFVGAEPDGHLAVYQGVPWDLGFGIKLYRKVYESPLLTANLTQTERRSLLDHDLGSRRARIAALHAYEQDVVP
jgi:protein phosphatase